MRRKPRFTFSILVLLYIIQTNNNIKSKYGTLSTRTMIKQYEINTIAM